MIQKTILPKRLLSNGLISSRLLVASLLVLACTACQKQPESPIQTDATPTTTTAPARSMTIEEANSASNMPVTDASTAVTIPAAQWLGEWTGPEGTYLQLAQVGADYQLTISDLDGPKTFRATATPTGLSFERNGQTETIAAGSGAQTGMKWLTEKQDCLIVKLGEGYCRG